MSVMRVIVLHQYIQSLKFVGLLIAKIWLIFGHGVNGLVTLTFGRLTCK